MRRGAQAPREIVKMLIDWDWMLFRSLLSLLIFVLFESAVFAFAHGRSLLDVLRDVKDFFK